MVPPSDGEDGAREGVTSRETVCTKGVCTQHDVGVRGTTGFYSCSVRTGFRVGRCDNMRTFRRR